MTPDGTYFVGGISLPDISSYTFPVWIMIVLTGMATIATMVMVKAGHYPVLIPAALSLFWIMLSYLSYEFRIIDEETRVAMIRNGIAVLCLAVISGAVCYIGRHRGSSNARPNR